MKQTFALERLFESESQDVMTDAPVHVFHSQRVKLVVGSDGVRVDAASLRRVVSFRTVLSVEVVDESSLTIEHARGFEFLRALDAKGKSAADLAQEILQVIAWRRGQFRAAGIEHTAISGLATIGAASDRIAQLRALGVSPVSTYRQMSVAHEDLWRLVESPAASVSERIAAIVVLRVRASEDLAARVEVTADELVDDLVAHSLRIAASGDDRQLEALFAEKEGVDIAQLSLPERLRRRKTF